MKSFGSPEQCQEGIQMLFGNWNPLAPSKTYCESVGWEVNADGTVDTPGGFRLKTSDTIEVEKLETIYRRP